MTAALAPGVRRSLRLFGIETEYAFAAIGHAGERRTHELVGELLRTAAGFLKHLPGAASSGLFLGNGARLYVDCRSHPELATPECTDPWDAVRHVIAGDRIVERAARAAAERHPEVAEVLVFRTNVDYGGSGATWGRHESYAHRAKLRDLPAVLVPHLVSRLVFTGAGGFDSRSPGIRFLVSPRVAHLTATVSHESTTNRGIFHTKNEQLARNGHRLHVICGDTLCGQTGTWLKLATTALVVALAEAGISSGVELEAPLAAMRTFAEDPECRVEVPLAGGGRATAIDLQRRYLELAEAHASDRVMPAWAPEACARWRAMLELIAGGRPRVRTLLDWAIKHEVIERHMTLRGFDRPALEAWNRFAGARSAQEGAVPRRPAGDPSPFEEFRRRFLGALVPVDAHGVRKSTDPEPLLREHGLDRDGLARFEALRAELFELDIRFGQLGPTGIFASLDRDGLLDHVVPGVDRIDEAMHTPPCETRAHARGACITEHSGSPDLRCEWNAVHDTRNHRRLDLGDPLDSTGRWVPETGDTENDDS